MRRVGAHNEGRLEEILARVFGATTIVLKVPVAATLAPGRLFVPEPETQKLRRIVCEERLHCPLRSRGGRVLRPVVTQAELPLRQLPVVERLEPGEDVESLAVAGARLVYPVRIGDDDVSEGEEILGDERGGGAVAAG